MMARCGATNMIFEGLVGFSMHSSLEMDGEIEVSTGCAARNQDAV
jgi:hypothetical protein